MRIKRLWLSSYKNLKNLDLRFTGNKLITLLVGQNGLGKSNLIEILGLIFRDLDLIYDEEELANWPYAPRHFEYVLEYECHDKEIKVECRASSFKVYLKKRRRYDPVTFTYFIKNKRRTFLPDFIIGYYSGENKRIREIIRPHEERECDRLRNFHRTRKTENGQRLRRLFFVENRHSDIVLLTLALYRHVPDYSQHINRLLGTYLNIESIPSCDVLFRNPPWYKHNPRAQNNIDFLVANISQSNSTVTFPFWGLKGKMDELLTLFYNYQLEWSEPRMYPEEDRFGRKWEFIDFKGFDLEDFAQVIRKAFPHPQDFFYSIEAAAVLEVLHSINLHFTKPKVDAISFDQLSEGERQLLTVLGLILITGKEDCLFLLDEPDTHLNPKWQRDYNELLEEFNLNDDNSHIVVATHSPLIVQSSHLANVVLFHQTRKGTVKARVGEIPFHTWRIDHVLTSPYFDLESARPKNEQLDAYMRKRQQILSKEKLTAKDRQELATYQDDFGLLPTGETFTDLKALHYIHNKAKNDTN